MVKLHRSKHSSDDCLVSRKTVDHVPVNTLDAMALYLGVWACQQPVEQPNHHSNASCTANNSLVTYTSVCLKSSLNFVKANKNYSKKKSLVGLTTHTYNRFEVLNTIGMDNVVEEPVCFGDESDALCEKPMSPVRDNAYGIVADRDVLWRFGGLVANLESSSNVVDMALGIGEVNSGVIIRSNGIKLCVVLSSLDYLHSNLFNAGQCMEGVAWLCNSMGLDGSVLLHVCIFKNTLFELNCRAQFEYV